ncbi:3-deoxy-D-manno-octulosonic acid kinase [Pseudoalteromonas piscicida]|uniref:3-deoxy-D-manno-octulosonic acid kinase n=1 Tax=Pseudoalteromonas piscicida TaxID=43662 RepID=A0A2A5JQ42_PSEO7|nr:3-deoxy-D-manno-octulosonic acid kinase [Pseudoalteromonas piscicida]PCK31546.1 3-deoxy-D-manno-octulosonic acid kinase [Pseudoalteromonas piscicida]
MQIIKQPHYFLLTPSHSALTISAEMFEPEYWQNNNAVVGSKQGRATAWFVKFNQGVAVLKHYYRGGLIGKLLSDQYIFTRLENTRVYQEFALLEQLQALGLPVPAPIAARISLRFGIYRADILTEAVDDATSVCEILQTRALSNDELERIAHTIAKFHRAGAYHDDLNINNILFNGDGEVFLIDFDKGKMLKPAATWQQANIDRLQRSFKKEAGKWPTFYFEDNQWQALVQAYRSSV